MVVPVADANGNVEKPDNIYKESQNVGKVFRIINSPAPRLERTEIAVATWNGVGLEVWEEFTLWKPETLVGWIKESSCHHGGGFETTEIILLPKKRTN